MALFDSTDYKLITKNHPLYTSLRLERNELAYFYYKNGNKKYLLLPSVHRPDIPKIECYEFFSDETMGIVNSKEVIKELASPYMKRFLAACRQIIEAVNNKIAFSIQHGYSYNILIPKMGAYVLYLVFHRFYGVTWDNSIFVNYTKKNDGTHRKNMRNALKPYLKNAFHGNKKGYSLIIIDEFVSGTSIDTLFKDFLLTLDKDLGINFEAEKDFYYALLLKRYAHFYQKNGYLRKKIQVTPEYAYHYQQLLSFISDRIPKEKIILLHKSKDVYEDFRTYLQVYFLEIKELLSFFKSDFFNYLNIAEQREFNGVANGIASVIQSISELLTDIESNKQVIAKHMTFLLAFYRKIIDLNVKNSFIIIGISRRIYQEWLAAFNIHIFFVTISDASRYNEDIFKMKGIYHALFQRNLVEAFSAIGILTMDILTDNEIVTLQKIEGLPQSLDGFPRLQELVKFLELFVE